MECILELNSKQKIQYMSLEPKLEDVKYGIVAVLKEDGSEDYFVAHFCGYLEKPEESDWESLRQELETDEEFGLVGMDFELMEATPDMIKYFATDEESSIS
jgi:hypothetical protein